MLKRTIYLAEIVFFGVVLSSCSGDKTINANNRTIQVVGDGLTQYEHKYNDFNSFIEKFSTDTAFQISRTQFPLKISWHGIESDTTMYRNKSAFEFIDFKEKEYLGELDQWRQYMEIDKNNKSAIIEIRGIDNGIHVDYIFKMINGLWMFTEIDDSST